MRAVFDTNVVVSALIFGRRLAWLRRSWANSTTIPIVCRETAAELLRVLTYPKFRLDGPARELLLADYLPYAEIAILPDPLPDLPVPCRDPNDAVFLHLAIASRANLLVSGDRHLTILTTAYARVVSPTTLQHRLTTRNQSPPARDSMQ